MFFGLRNLAQLQDVWLLMALLNVITQFVFLREQVVIYEGSLESLKRFKDDVNEVKKGMECGLALRITMTLKLVTTSKFRSS